MKIAARQGAGKAAVPGGGLGELLRFRELLAERHTTGSLDRGYNRALLRALVQMHPGSAGAVND